MKRREFIASALALVPATVFANDTSARRRVAFFSPQALEVVRPRVAAFRERLAEHGFVDGRNLDLRFFCPEEGASGMEEAIRAMVAWDPDVIHAAFSAVILEIRRATDRIPIVYRAVGDPLAYGFIASHSRPGGNITGISSPGHLLIDKLLELAREILPNARRLVIVREKLTAAGAEEIYAKTLEGVRRRNFEHEEIEVAPHSNGLRDALEHAISARAEVLLPYGSFLSVRGPFYPVLIEFERRHRIPVLFTTAEVVRDGALMGYGFEILDAVLLAANMVAAILKGANPAELPAQIASRIELALNLRTAREMGIQFPKTVLMRADKVIR